MLRVLKTVDGSEPIILAIHPDGPAAYLLLDGPPLLLGGAQVLPLGTAIFICYFLLGSILQPIAATTTLPLSSLCLHNILRARNRRLQEITRILIKLAILLEPRPHLPLQHNPGRGVPVSRRRHIQRGGGLRATGDLH